MALASSFVKHAIRQRLAQVAKPYAVRYITKHYGTMSGQIAGLGISIAVGDYYGAIKGISVPIGDKPFRDRDTPFGYYPGGKVDGQTNGSFGKALRASQYPNGKYKHRKKQQYCQCGCKRCKRPGLRSRRRLLY